MTTDLDASGILFPSRRSEFAHWADEARREWEPRGFHVHVNTNGERIVITPSLGKRLGSK